MNDCIIVGGGIAGMMSALELRRSGLSVLLLEKGQTGRESSWAGGGILSPLYPWRYTDPVTTLAGWGQAHYPDALAALHEQTGLDPEYQPSGFLTLAPGDDRQALDWAEAHGVNLQTVGANKVHEIEPRLGKQLGGLWLPEVGQVRNPRLVKSLRMALELIGVDVREGAEVTGFVTHKGQIKGVETRNERFDADRVLVSGGAWTGSLLADLGLSLDIKPVRGQMILFKGPVDFLKRIVIYQDRYAIPRRDGRILMGSTLEHVGFNKGTTDAARTDLQAAAIDLIPGLAEFDIEHHWSGLRPGKTDNVPVIGEHPQVRGLFVNAGHYRNGVVLGLASSRLVSDLILDRTPILDPAPYAPQTHSD